MPRTCSSNSSAVAQRGAILITSNRSVGESGTVFGDAVVATAILDRLLHHSHVVTIRGDSCRLKEKRRSGLLQNTAAVEAKLVEAAKRRSRTCDPSRKDAPAAFLRARPLAPTHRYLRSS